MINNLKAIFSTQKLYLKYNDYRYIVESKGYEDENFEVRVEYEIDYAKKICKRNEYNKMRYI